MFTIQTIGGLETLATLFNAIAAIFHGPVIKAFTVLIISISAVSAMVYAIWRNDLKPLTSWFVAYNILTIVLLSPVARVNITDTMTGRFRVIDNVPFALALVSSTFSTLSVSLTQSLEQVMQPLPPQGASQSASGVDFAQASYSKTGFIFGAQAIANMKAVQMTNHDMEENMKEFACQCVVYPALNGSRYTLEDLQKSDDIWGLVSESPSKLLGFAWRNVERTEQGKFIRSGGTEIITCAEGVRRFNQLWAQSTESALSNVYSKIAESFGVKAKDHSSLSFCVASHFPTSLNKLIGSAKSASDRIRQQMMISSILKGNIQKTLELGGQANFEAARAYLQQRQSYQTIGEVVSQTLLSLKNVIEALAYALFVFVMLFALLPQGVKIFIFWAKIVGWIQLWPPLFSILNFLATEALASAISGTVGTSSGLTIWNIVGVYNLASDMAATAGYISCMIPVIAWAILDHGGYAFVSVVSQLLGVTQGAATAAAIEKTTGNYSFGNVSMDGVQSSNINMLKHDRSASYSGGHFATQDGSSSRVFAANGEQIISRGISQLPVTIHGAQVEDQTYRDLYSEAESFHQSEAEQATRSRQATVSDYLQIGRHASSMISAGEQWSNQETATTMNEAANAYSKAKRISMDFGISEELVNQKLADASAGLNVSIDTHALSPIHVAGGLGGNINKQELAASRATKAENAIKDLASSEDFRKSIQVGYHNFNSSNFDVNDQNVKEAISNYSGNYEKAISHQENASKAYEASKAMQQEMALSKTRSLSIDSNYSQDFVNHVGAERLEVMTTKEMQKEAAEFIAKKAESFKSNLQKKYDLKGQYESSDLKIGKPEIIKDQIFSEVKAKSAQEGIGTDRYLQNNSEIQAKQVIDINRLKTIKAQGRLGAMHEGSIDRFKGNVEKHARSEMGFLQNSAVMDMHDSFDEGLFNEKDKKTPIEHEYTAVNLEPKKPKRLQEP